MADTVSLNPNQIVFVAPTFVSEDGSPVDVTGFVVTTASADETLAKWDRYTAEGQPDPAGQYGVRSFDLLGAVAVTYSVKNMDGSDATLTGTVTIENEEAFSGSMNFSAAIDVPPAV